MAWEALAEVQALRILKESMVRQALTREWAGSAIAAANGSQVRKWCKNAPHETGVEEPQWRGRASP